MNWDEALLLNWTEVFEKARANMWKAQQRFKCFPNVQVWINDHCAFYMDDEEPWYGNEDTSIEPWLKCSMPDELLAKILHREVHWNNAEIGCLISFDRRPNVYMPDVHTLMSFFHL